MKKSRIDKAVDLITSWIESALAVAFIFAVLLNFINVCTRYIFSYSMLSADEIQVFIMIVMTFLGAAVVTWRRQHLRMDILLEISPAWVRRYSRVLELVTFIVICGFITYQSFLYTRQMWLIDRRSDMAEAPMWIPHGSIVVGFALMLAIVIWQAFSVISRRAPLVETEKTAEDAASK